MTLTSRDPWRGAADGDDVQSAFMFVTSQKQQTVVAVKKHFPFVCSLCQFVVTTTFL